MTEGAPDSMAVWGPCLLTSPGLAFPDEEGPTSVPRQQQQVLSLLPTQAFIQPPAAGQGGVGWQL